MMIDLYEILVNYSISECWARMGSKGTWRAGTSHSKVDILHYLEEMCCSFLSS